MERHQLNRPIRKTGVLIWATLLAAAAILLATSCSKPKVIEPDAGVGEIRKGMTKQQVEAKLGRPDGRIDPNDDWMWKYHRKGLMVLFGNDGVMFNVHCFKPFAGVTPEGIGIGSTREAAIKAYGTPNEIKQINPQSENLWFARQKISCTLVNKRITEMVVHLDL